MVGRLVLHAAGPGAWNMAVDEALLASVAAAGVPCLRFYGWAPATLSLGYFQRVRDRESHAESRAAPVVRRATGGGAIVHHHEITYSFVAAAASRSASESQMLYRVFHRTAAELLRALGVPAGLCALSGGISPATTGTEPFLCFLRRAEGDVVAGNTKVLGSAQRRVRGAILQHGSLLFGQSPYAPQLTGLAEWISEPRFDAGEFCRRWQAAVGRQLGVVWRTSDLTDEEAERAETHRAEKFHCARWTHRR